MPHNTTTLFMAAVASLALVAGCSESNDDSVETWRLSGPNLRSDQSQSSDRVPFLNEFRNRRVDAGA